MRPEGGNPWEVVAQEASEGAPSVWMERKEGRKVDDEGAREDR